MVQGFTKEIAAKLRAFIAQSQGDSVGEAHPQNQSPSFLDSIVENLPNMIFVKDARDLRFVSINRAGEALLGVSRAHLIGKNDYDFFPEEQASFFTYNDLRVLEGKQVIDIPEEPIDTKLGTRYLHTKKIPILDDQGHPRYLLGISEDITEKKLAEQQKIVLLREQAARAEAEKTADRLAFLSEASAALSETLDYQTTLSSFAEIIVSNFADWCVIDLPKVNGKLSFPSCTVAHRDSAKKEWAKLWREKYPIDWEASTGVAQVMRTGDAEIYSHVTSEMLRTGSDSEEKYQDLLKVGFKSVMMVPLKAYGKVFGVITLVSTNESGRVFDEFDLSLAQDLSKRAAFAIEHARLFLEAQEANRAKSVFLANMSHEIRTPLGAMLGFAEMVEESGPLVLEQQKSLATIVKNGRQLLRIVDEILDLSKVESEKMELEKIRFSLPHLIEEVTSLLRLKAQEKGLDFIVTPSKDLPSHLVSDPTRLRQILLNVIGNSIKFTESGSIRLSVRLLEQKTSAGHCCLEFSVEDTGVGIDPKQVKSLFQPFAQADSSMTRKFGGTGLGLVLSRKLARMLGGDLVLTKSIPHVGSTFVVTIEAPGLERRPESEEYVPATEEAHKIKASVVSRSKGACPSVLVVDDAADNRTLVNWYLDRLGYKVDVAADGHEGVKKTLNNSYDVVLMDIQMPEMDGFEAVEHIRSHKYTGTIIALTAHAMKGDRERCLNAGFDDYLIKPIDKEILRETLAKYIKDHDARPIEMHSSM